MAFTENLLVGLAEWLDAQGLGEWSTAQISAPTGPVISVNRLPDQHDVSIMLTASPVTSDSHLSDSVVNVQVRTRSVAPREGGRTTGADNVSDPIFEALHNLRNVDIGGIWVERIDHIGGASMGADDKGRPERSDNYQLELLRPTPLRT